MKCPSSAASSASARDPAASARGLVGLSQRPLGVLEPALRPPRRGEIPQERPGVSGSAERQHGGGSFEQIRRGGHVIAGQVTGGRPLTVSARRAYPARCHARPAGPARAGAGTACSRVVADDLPRTRWTARRPPASSQPGEVLALQIDPGLLGNARVRQASRVRRWKNR